MALELLREGNEAILKKEQYVEKHREKRKIKCSS